MTARGDAGEGARSYLFLQGTASPFFRRLAHRLSSRGHRVNTLCFNGGDELFWLGCHYLRFRATLDTLPQFVETVLGESECTDLVAFGDARPVHIACIQAARRRSLRLHLFEEGYMRPGWITIEHAGLNGYSDLPRCPTAIAQRAERLAPRRESSAPREGLFLRGVYDIAYHWANFFLSPLYPGYRNHRRYRAYQEYAGWARRHLVNFIRTLKGGRRGSGALDSETPYFLFPLQLDGDTQLDVHSTFSDVAEIIDTVVTSFAHHAPPGHRLLVKRHPLDTGIVDHAGQVKRLAQEHGLGERVVYFEGGDLTTLLTNASGAVMVNSTVGMLALSLGCPVKALGNAVYDIPGLTTELELAAFWDSPHPPDPRLLDQFREVLIAETQVRGNYYTPAGIKIALPECVVRLEADG